MTGSGPAGQGVPDVPGLTATPNPASSTQDDPAATCDQRFAKATSAEEQDTIAQECGWTTEPPPLPPPQPLCDDPAYSESSWEGVRETWPRSAALLRAPNQPALTDSERLLNPPDDGSALVIYESGATCEDADAVGIAAAGGVVIFNIADPSRYHTLENAEPITVRSTQGTITEMPMTETAKAFVIYWRDADAARMLIVGQPYYTRDSAIAFADSLIDAG